MRLLFLLLFSASLYAAEFEGEVKGLDFRLAIADTTPLIWETNANSPDFNDIEIPVCIVGEVRGYCVLRFRGLTDVQITDLSYQHRNRYQLEFYEAIDLFSGDVNYIWDSDGLVIDKIYYSYLDHYGVRCNWAFSQQPFGLFVRISTGPCESAEVPEKTAPISEPTPFVPIVTGDV